MNNLEKKHLTKGVGSDAKHGSEDTSSDRQTY